MMTIEKRIRMARDEWAAQFAGGLLPFDNAYWDTLDKGNTTRAEATHAGCNALLDRYTDELIATLKRSGMIER